MHVLAAAKPVVPSPLDCSALHAWNSSQCTNLHQKPVLSHLCPFTAAIECDLLVGSSSPKLRLASYQTNKQKFKVRQPGSYQLCISFLIPSHLVSRASVVIAPVPWWPQKF